MKLSDNKEEIIGGGCLLIAAMVTLAFVGSIYYGIYCLLDKLIDKL